MEGKSSTILVIEDERVVRDSIVRHLEDEEYIVLSAENGKVGLEVFQQELPDIVLTDLRMPEMDGLRVLKNIGKISPDTPLVVISGTGNIADTVQALRRGAWDYITKPVEDMSIITIAVEKALERSRLRKENKLYQENLEVLVQKRTEELGEANKHLVEINTRLENIVNTARKLSLCEDVSRFGSTLLSEFANHMVASGGSLFLVEEDGLRKLNTLEPGHVPDFIPFPLREGSVLKRTIEEEKPLLVKDINTEAGLKSSGWEGYRDGSVLSFPLPDETGKIIGILTLHSKAQPPFLEQDKEIGSILASYSCETLRAVQLSEAVRESENRQRIILNSLGMGILVIDPQIKTIVDCNPEASRLIGCTENELIGKDCARFFYRDDECPYTSPDPAQSLDSTEQILLTSNGREIPVLKRIAPVKLKGKTHYLESFIDISRQKEIEQEKNQLESQLVQAQKMEAIGTLAGGLAHDLNNALNGIYAPASSLLRKIDLKEQIPNELLLKQCSRIHKSTLRIMDMVSQLMTVSQKQELSLITVDLNYSLRHVLKIAHNTFDKSIEIVPNLFESAALVHADPTQIEQVLLNLLINASHAMTIMRKEDELWGGKLEVSILSIQTDRYLKNRYPEIKDGYYWVIVVNDTGVGIEDEEQPRIFTPFYTTKKKGKGTGLGLAMVYNIINQHKGFIGVHSIPDVGTTFEIYLPQWVKSSGEQGNVKKRKSIQTGEGLILIVDDEKVLRSSTEEILSECGYQTISAENGKQAVEIFKEKHREIDLVILDLIMPKMSGSEAYKLIKEIDQEVKVLLVSGVKQDDRIKLVLDKGVTGFLQKPYDLYSLSTSVKECLS